jgi:hypothetical protein
VLTTRPAFLLLAVATPGPGIGASTTFLGGDRRPASARGGSADLVGIIVRRSAVLAAAASRVPALRALRVEPVAAFRAQ